MKRIVGFFIFLIYNLGIAQNTRFKHLSINEGLSQNAVFSITQSSDGFMWFGTKDGLNKYDGYNFKVYQHNPNNPSSISSSYITALYSDKAGNFWIGSKNGILNRYQKETDSFQRISLPLENLTNKNSYEIEDISEDQNGTIWIGTRYNGLFKIPLIKNKVIKNKIKQYSNSETGKHKISNNTIRDLYNDKKGNLWIGTNKGLNKMNLKTEAFKSFYFDIKDSRAPNTNQYQDMAVASIYSNEEGVLWLGTLSGLIRFNTVDYSYKVFKHHYAIHRYGWGEIKDIVEDSKGNFWLATSAELMHFNTKTKAFVSYKNEPLNPYSLSFNSISSLFVDKSKIVWIGTAGMGINYYDPKSQRFSLLKRKEDKKSRINGFSIRCVFEENDRYVWISSDVLYRWDRITNTLKSFEKSFDKVDSFGNTGAWSIIKTRDENLWFATTEGLYVYNPLTEKTKQFTYNENDLNAFPQKNVLSVYEDHTGYLWIATENYLCKMIDRKKGIFKQYPYSKGTTHNVFGRPVLYQDASNKIWIGTNKGLLVFDIEKETFYTFRNQPGDVKSLISNHIKSICPDPKQPERFLWIGTSGGLDLLDKKEKTFTHFTQADGLPNNVIYGILVDSKDKLWLSTNKGISEFNPKNKTFRNFDVNDGLQSNEFNTGAYYKSKKGELFFGGISGLSYFFSEQIKDNPFIPSVALTKIKVLKKSKSKSKENSFITVPFLKNKELTFTHQDNIITFEFAALDFSAPSKNQYAYKLDNFNKNWVYINNNRTTTFTNLPSGEYTFRVKASNNDGIWNETGISIPIKILPHWSNTWWAYGVYLLLILELLYLIRKYELKRFYIKNQLEVERIETKTLRSLDQLKSRFFTNISHEIRTPLTLISGEAERLLEELKNKQTRAQIKTIDKNAKRLLQLINQLLDVSKLEAGKMKLHPTQSNLVLFLKNLFYSFESFATKKKIQLIFSAETKNIQAVFDSEKMEKIITNLLSNALKFTPEKGTISLQIQQKNIETVTIAISDTGIGISEVDIPYIFDRFYQVDNSDTRVFEGTGIGLALVKELTLLHQGKIRVFNNTTTSGVTFVLELPIGNIIEKNETLELPLINKPLPPYSELQKNDNNIIPILPFDKKVILLVEDNADIRQFIKEQLHVTYKITEAMDGVKGLEMAQKIIPDLIITDVMMPKMDGFTMVRHIKESETSSHIPIIMLTGKSSYDDKIEGLETGVDAFLTKPFSTKELKIRISKLIAQRELLSAKYKDTFAINPEELSISSLDQKFLEKTFKHLKENLDNPNFSIEELANKMCLSSSQLHRKLQALVNQAPGKLLRNMRLQKAAELIKLNAGNIADICFKTGFNDQAYFSRAFKNQFGCSPSAYKKEFF